VNDIGCAELGQEGRYDVGQKNNAFRDIGADKIKRSGENNDIKNVID
jgi:hypothetical protein